MHGSMNIAEHLRDRVGSGMMMSRCAAAAKMRVVCDLLLLLLLLLPPRRSTPSADTSFVVARRPAPLPLWNSAFSATESNAACAQGRAACPGAAIDYAAVGIDAPYAGPTGGCNDGVAATLHCDFGIRMSGLAPRYRPDGVATNGGPPQLMNLSVHLERWRLDSDFSDAVILGGGLGSTLWWGANVADAQLSPPASKSKALVRTERLHLRTLALAQEIRPKARWGWRGAPACSRGEGTQRVQRRRAGSAREARLALAERRSLLASHPPPQPAHARSSYGETVWRAGATVPAVANASARLVSAPGATRPALLPYSGAACCGAQGLPGGKLPAFLPEADTRASLLIPAQRLGAFGAAIRGGSSSGAGPAARRGALASHVRAALGPAARMIVGVGAARAAANRSASGQSAERASGPGVSCLAGEKNARSRRARKHDDAPAPVAALPADILKQRRYGVNIEGAASFADEQKMSNASWARLALAFSAVRVDVTWQLVEQTRNVYNFSVYDHLFARCAEVGVLPYIILDYDNRLYGRCPEGHCLCTANAVAAFVNYAVAVVKRFSHAMAFELWNEPNLHGARPHNMPVQAYSALLTAVGGALKKSATHAVLVAGATAGVDAGYIGALGKSGALQYADAVSVHPYTGSCGGPELFDDPSTWQHGLIEQLRCETDLPIVWSELGWSTCSDPHNSSVSATCASFPGSQDTLDDQAIFLARQWLLGALNAAPALFVFEWANGDGLPDGQHNTAATNASNGGDNFGLNWGMNGPPKPAYTAAAHFQAAVGRRDLIGRIQPMPPPQMHLDERRWEGGGSSEANLTYILAFAAQRPVGSFATVAPRPPGPPPEAYSVYSLQMTGAVAQQTGAGDRTSCPGFLARLWLPTTAACEEACRSTPRCRSFVFWPRAGNVSCSLCGSRCLSPGVVLTGRCSGDGGPGGCAGALAFTLRQSAKQNVTFAVPAGGARCYAVTDAYGAAGTPATICARGGGAANGRLLEVGATDAPIYLTALKSEEQLKTDDYAAESTVAAIDPLLHWVGRTMSGAEQLCRIRASVALFHRDDIAARSGLAGEL
eukprot:SAG11_NODE_308_length_10943_cov_6.679609_2_plen_1063_part_00